MQIVAQHKCNYADTEVFTDGQKYGYYNVMLPLVEVL